MQNLRRRGSQRLLGFERLEDRVLLAVFTVLNSNDNGPGSLRQAIADANAQPGADEINFAVSANGEIDLTTGEMTITQDLTITGNGAASTIIDAQGSSRIFNMGNVNFTVSGLTLKNGSSTGSGGAILHQAASGSLTILNSTLTGNTTSAISGGGAVYVNDAALIVSGSTFSNNSVTGLNGDGGAIYADGGPVSIANSTFSGNFTTNSQGHGGAIFRSLFGAEADMVITDSTFSNNRTDGGSSNGGAIEIDGIGNLHISNSTLSGNTAAGDRGGAISVNRANVFLTGTTLNANGARYGAGIDSSETGNLTLVNSTLSGNSATATGGGFFSTNGDVLLRNSTLTLNQANYFGGLFISGNNAGESLTIQNSIVAGNLSGFVTSGDDFRIAVAGNLTVSHSLIGDNRDTTLTATIGSTPDANGNFIGTGAAQINPQLGALAFNGGPTQTHAIANNTSLAFNSGNNSFTGGLGTDQRGVPFSRISGGRVDMGAYEATAPTILGSTAFFTGTSQDDAMLYNATSRVWNFNGFNFTLPVAVTTVDIDTLAGQDNLALIGSAGNDRAVLNPSNLTSLIDLGNNGAFDVVGRNAEFVQVLDGGGAADIAVLNDTSGNDTFFGSSLVASMSGNGYLHIVQGFESISGRSIFTGDVDTALFNDSAGNDTFSASPTLATLGGTGFVVAATNFDSVIATANTGGTDRAFFNDGAGNDTFEVSAASMSAVMSGPNGSGGTYVNQVRLFEQISSTSSAGGTDLAIFNDSAGNDTFVSRPAVTFMNSAGFTSAAVGFAGVTARATAGGTDSAFLEDSTGNDTFFGAQGYGLMTYANGRTHEARGFGVTAAQSIRGGFDVATFHDTAGNDTLSNNSLAGQVNFANASGLFLQSLNFDRVNVFANNGGALDRAFLNDTAGNDFFAGSGADGLLTTPQFLIGVSLFDAVAITATTGSNTFTVGTTAYTFSRVGNWVAV